MPLIDAFPPLFPSAPTGYISNYYSSDPLNPDNYSSADFVRDPYQISQLGISDKTLLKPKYYDSARIVNGVVEIDKTFPLEVGVTFASLLREDDTFVGKLTKNSFLLSSLGIDTKTLTARGGVTFDNITGHAPVSPSFTTLLAKDDTYINSITKNAFLLTSLGIGLGTLTAASGGNVALFDITNHAPTTATFTTLLAKDSAFAVNFTFFNVNTQTLNTGGFGSVVGKTPTQFQAALTNNTTLNQLLTVFYLTTSYKIRTSLTREVYPSSDFQTTFNKDFSKKLFLDDNPAIVSQTSRTSILDTNVTFIDTFVRNTIRPLRYDGLPGSNYSVFEGASGNRYAPISAATRVIFGNAGYIPGDPIFDQSNFSLTNLFYNNSSLIKYLTSIDIDTINVSAQYAYITAVSTASLTGTSITVNTLSTTNLTADTLTVTTLKNSTGTTFNVIDYLPLTGGVLTGDITAANVSLKSGSNITFQGPGYISLNNASKLDTGRFDTGRGGNSGISLVCSANNDFNWQAGWIAALSSDRKTNVPLYVDSGAGTTVRVWSGVGIKSFGTEISHEGITALTGRFNLGISSASVIATSGLFTTLTAITLSSTRLTGDIGIFNTSLSSASITGFNGVYAKKFYTIGTDGVPVEFVGSGGSGGTTISDPLKINGVSCINLTAIDISTDGITALRLTTDILTIRDRSIFYADVHGVTAENLSAEYIYGFNTISSVAIRADIAIFKQFDTTAAGITGLIATNLTATDIFTTTLKSSSVSSTEISGINLTISNNIKHAALTATNNNIKIIKPIISDENITTFKDISCANIWGTIQGTINFVGDSQSLIYLSARRADVNTLTSYNIDVIDRTIINTVPSVDNNGDPIVDSLGNPVTIDVPQIVSGVLNATDASFNTLVVENNTTLNKLTAADITSTESIILSSAATGVAFYATTDNKIGIKTSDPQAELSVLGSISASNQITTEKLIVTNSLNCSSISAATLTADNIFASLDIKSLSGKIYGSIDATQYTAINLFNEISSASLTSLNIYSTVLSATTISSVSGNSNLWTDGYYVPITINLIIDGSGSPIQGNVTGRVEIPYNIKLSSWSMYSDIASQTSFTTVTVLSSNYDSYPNTAPLYLSQNDIPVIQVGEIKNTAAITDGEWLVDLNKGDILLFGLSPELASDNSKLPASATSITLSLRGIRQS